MLGIAGYAMLALSVASPGQQMEELPNCGVVAVYAVARHYQKDVSLQDVQSLLPDRTGYEEGHSLAEIRSAVGSLGLHARSVRVTSESLDQLHCPSIIYIRPERMGLEDVGHFTVLQSVTVDAVRIVDLTRSPRPLDIPRNSLFKAWDGECLEISEKPFLLPTAGVWRMMWGFVGLCMVIVLYRSVRTKRSRKNHLAMLLCLLCCAVGCNKSFSTPITQPVPLIMFEEDAFSGGTVPRGPEAEVRCRFVVGDEKLVITSIESECGCIRPDDQLVGQELLPGTKHSFVVTLDTVGRFAKAGGFLTVQTDPPSPTPIRCHASVYVDAPPQLVGSMPVRVETTVGKTPVIEILLEHFRGDNRKPIAWDEERSGLAGFSVVRTDFAKEQILQAHSSMAGTGSHDVFRWKLRVPEDLSIGRHSFELKFAWKNDSYPAQNIPVEVNVIHPIHLSLDRVFFGIIKQGTPRDIDVNVTNWETERMEALQVESDSDFVAPKLDPKTGTISIRLSELAPPGRLEANIHIRNHQQTPELKIPVTAVIMDNANAVPSGN